MRTRRLMDLLQVLRRHQRPISGRKLAAELETSLRTAYLDIEGEPGVGYVLRPSFFLPPLMLSQTETEALMLGMRWVSTFADKPLSTAATDALSKIEAVLTKTARDGAGAVPLRVGPPISDALAGEDLTALRNAIRHERKLEIAYRNSDGRESQRVIWPFAIGYFTNGRILVGWCENRGDYRHFRTDRLVYVHALPEAYPRRRQEMLREWRERQHRTGADRSRCKASEK